MIVEPLGDLVAFEVNGQRMIASSRNHNHPGSIGAVFVEGQGRADNVADEDDAIRLRGSDFVASEFPTRDRFVIIEVDDVGDFHAFFIIPGI